MSVKRYFDKERIISLSQKESALWHSKSEKGHQFRRFKEGIARLVWLDCNTNVCIYDKDDTELFSLKTNQTSVQLYKRYADKQYNDVFPFTMPR